MTISKGNPRDFCPPDITELRVDEPPLPVANVAAEQGLLGAVLFEADKHFERIKAVVTTSDFAWRCHQLIFEAVAKLVAAGLSPNSVTLAHLFRDRTLWPGGNPTRYLDQLARSTVTLHNNVHYAVIVADCALRRDLAAELLDPQPVETTLDVLERHRARICRLKAVIRELQGGDDARPH